MPFVFVILLGSLLSAGPGAPSDSSYYEISTPQGSFVIRLFDETPQHRDNFRRLVAEGFYDGTTFHRIIDHFMIQGGDPNSRDADPFNDGAGDPGYTIEAEIIPGLLHRRGMVAAARTSDAVNPERRSNGSQFYVVQGTTYDDATLDRVETQVRALTGDPAFAFSDSARTVYRDVGGAPSLDAQYTIFAQVIEGLDVVDAIAGLDTPRRTGRPAHPQLVDRPFDPVPMTIRPLPDFEESGAAAP